MSIWDEMIKAVPVEDRTALDRYPQLKASMDQLEVASAQLAANKQQWDKWVSENWDPTTNTTRREAALLNELATVNAKVVELESAPNRSGADADELAKLRKEVEDRVKSLETGSLAAIEGMNRYYRAAATRVLPHFQEFKENFDPDKLLTYMRENRLNDPDTAYDRMVAPRRAELAAQHQKDLDEKHQKEIEAAREEGYQKKAQEIAMGPQGVLPTDQTGGIAGITSRMEPPAKISDDVKTRLSEAKLGDGSLAQVGLEMFRRGELPMQ